MTKIPSLKRILMKRKKSLALLVMSSSILFFTMACTKNDSSSASSTASTITALTCASATFTATPVAGTAFTGTATVPYTGGNATAYTAGSAIASTGVTGLTATLQAGALASGAGNLTYTIAGTPAASGTAVFAITFGGQTCSISLTINAASSTACSLTGVGQVVCLSQAFKATLTATQIASLQIAYTHTNAIKWSNLPGGVSIRNGVEFSTLTAVQLAAAKAVIAAASGTTVNEGYSEFIQINAADDILGATAGSGYSSGKYIIAFLGEPSTTGNWILQFGGHHYAQNICYQAGAAKGSTPSHQGIEPTSWTSSGTTYTPLAQEKTVMAEMLASFTATELSGAKITTTFSDVLLGPNKDGQFPATKAGLKVSSLSSTAQAKVLAAMKPWLDDLDTTAEATLLATYTSELANTYVTYSNNPGATSGNAATFFTTNTDYVRIDGPSVWIEFVCQTGVVYSTQIHYHAVFRDHTRDYGGL
jgi:hypothetical protein